MCYQPGEVVWGEICYRSPLWPGGEPAARSEQAVTGVRGGMYSWKVHWAFLGRDEVKGLVRGR